MAQKPVLRAEVYARAFGKRANSLPRRRVVTVPFLEV